MKPLIRNARDADMAFVRFHWCRDAYEHSKDRPALYSMFRVLFEEVQSQILKHATVLVAVNSEDDEQIFGSIVFETKSTPVLHHIAVKREFRGNGLGKILLREAGFRRNKPAVFSLRPVPFKMAPKEWTFIPYGLMP